MGASMKILAVSVLLMAQALTACHADTKRGFLYGKWQWSDEKKGSVSVDIHPKDKDGALGRVCCATAYGSRVDCSPDEENISRIESTTQGLYEVVFSSFYDGTTSSASLRLREDGNLEWTSGSKGICAAGALLAKQEQGVGGD